MTGKKIAAFVLLVAAAILLARWIQLDTVEDGAISTRRVATEQATNKVGTPHQLKRGKYGGGFSASNSRHSSAPELRDAHMDADPSAAQTKKEPVSLGLQRHTGKAEVDKSFVGIPFPVSDSILKACHRYSEEVECEKNFNTRLRNFSLEPRDSEWALKTETALEQMIEGEGLTYFVRNIECRSSMCLLEVDSEQGQYIGSPIGLKRFGLRRLDAITAYEGLETGGRTTVTLEIYKREN